MTEKKNGSSDFRKTMTQGIGALLKGKKDYYILEHLVGSHYHQSGEKQEIMLDEVLLGRETDCHVRFDESFQTVSRHHASIVRDGDNWRLIQLSKTNTTFLNGSPIKDSWYLQSGDEIQLAQNGPKLIFRKPEDPSGMSFSQRLESFRNQVIQPYQSAFLLVCVVVALLIISCVAGGIIISNLHKDNSNQSGIIDSLTMIYQQQQEIIDAMSSELDQTNQQLIAAAKLADSAQTAAIQAQVAVFNAKAQQAKSNQDLKQVQQQLRELREEQVQFWMSVIGSDENNNEEY